MASVWKIRHRDSCLKLTLATTYLRDCENVTRELSIDNLMKVRFKITGVICQNNPKITLSISSTKHELAKCSTIKMNIFSDDLDFSKHDLLISDNWSDWQVMGSGTSFIKNLDPKMYYSMFDLHINVYVVNIETVTLKLYSDTDFTDFCLTTSEGNVAVHKSFLAAHSDVFKTMLSGEWKETAEGKLNIDGVTLETLQHLKDYMYLGTVPDRGLCPLLLIAKRYLIEDLEKQCIRKLAETVLATDLYSLIKFACENNIPELAYAILHITRDRIVEKAHELKKQETVFNSKG